MGRVAPTQSDTRVVSLKLNNRRVSDQFIPRVLCFQRRTFSSKLVSGVVSGDSPLLDVRIQPSEPVFVNIAHTSIVASQAS